MDISPAHDDTSVAKQMTPSSFHNSSPSDLAAVRRIGRGILVPAVLSYSYRGSVLLRRPVLIDRSGLFPAWYEAGRP